MTVVLLFSKFHQSSTISNTMRFAIKYVKIYKNIKVMTIKLHQARVMGVYIDSITEYLYTVGEDKKFKVHDLNKNYTVSGNYFEKLSI